MENIAQKIELINTAVLGKDVRSSLATGLLAVYNETIRNMLRQDALEIKQNVLEIKQNALEAKQTAVENLSNVTKLRQDAIDAGEADRIIAENARELAELGRANTFNNSETGRTGTFNASQSDRTTIFNASQTARITAFNINEADRASAESLRVTAENTRNTAETARGTAFNTSQTSRTNTFDNSEISRTTAYNTNEALRVTNEVNRINAFDASQTARTTTFGNSETSRTGTFNASEASRATTFGNSETARTNTFNTAETARETAFAEMEHVDANLELSTARGGEANLNARLNKTDSQLADKANQSDIRLNTTKLVLEDVDANFLGAIAGTGTFNLLSIPQDLSVDYNKLSSPLKTTVSNLDNLFYNKIIVNDYSGKVLNGFIAVGDTRIIGTALNAGNVIQNIKINCTTGGAIKIKLATKNTDGTFSWLKNINAILVIGENNIILNETILLENTYLGVYTPSGGAVINYIGSLTGQVPIHKFSGELTGNNILPTVTTTTTMLGITTTLIISTKNILQNNTDLNDILLKNNKDKIIDNLEFTNKIMTDTLLAIPQTLTTYSTVQDSGAISTTTYTRVINKIIKKGETLTKIKAFIKKVGTFTIVIVSKNLDNSFNLIQEYNFNANALGETEFISNIIAETDCYIGLYTDSVTALYSYAGTGSGLLYWTCTGKITTSTSGFSSSSTLYVQLSIKSTPTTMTDYVNKLIDDTLTVPQEILNMDGLKKLDKYSLCSTNFTTLPSEWVNNGFTLSNGLQSPTTGGTSITAYWDIYSTLDRHTIRARIKIIDITSSFALFKKYSIHGGIGVVDCNDMTLKLYKSWTGGALPVVNASIPITIPIVANREYIVTFVKDGSTHILTITDSTTGLSNFVSFDNSLVTYANYCGKAWGSPGVMFLNGDILIKKFEFLSDAPNNSKVVILGDSITEGYGLDSGTATYEDRWSAKVRATLNGNAVISGRGSGNVADLILRMDTDMDKFTPQYVILAIGTNDIILNNDLAGYKTNIDIAIDRIIAKGAIPILTCPPTNGENMDLFQQLYDYIDAKPYTVIHFNYATSVNNDGATFDSSLFADTSTHPNKAGHLKMFNQILIDAPEILE